MVGFGIRNLTHVEKGFKEMYRVLKTGGKMMCLEFSKPSAPIFRWLYDLYSFYIMPFLGGLIVGSKEAYRHLPESIRVFPLPEELTRLLENIGFHGVTHRKTDQWNRRRSSGRKVIMKLNWAETLGGQQSFTGFSAKSRATPAKKMMDLTPNRLSWSGVRSRRGAELI